MSNKYSNYPSNHLNDIPKAEVGDLVSNLLELHRLGRPKTDREVAERIRDYFELCANSCIRPGIESLCCSLCVSRQTLLLWSNGKNCSKERTELINGAKALVHAYLEQALLNGKISPPSGIFLLKNWCGYKDGFSIEEVASQKEEPPQKSLGTDDIKAILYGEKQKENDIGYGTDEVDKIRGILNDL